MLWRSWVGIKVGSKGPQLGDGNMGADISQESRNTLEINHLVSVAFDNVNSNTAQWFCNQYAAGLYIADLYIKCLKFHWKQVRICCKSYNLQIIPHWFPLSLVSRWSVGQTNVSNCALEPVYCAVRWSVLLDKPVYCAVRWIVLLEKPVYCDLCWSVLLDKPVYCALCWSVLLDKPTQRQRRPGRPWEQTSSPILAAMQFDFLVTFQLFKTDRKNMS